jgi:D-glycero-D-manno-heptose 1,7-bisphosphate phosphatase
MNKAVFLDRDGTINEEMGYINHVSRFKVFNFVPEAIHILNACGYKVIVVTNQSGVAKGYFKEELIKSVHAILYGELESKSARIDKIYYCPHHPEEGSPEYKIDCECRKPKPGMINAAKQEFDLDLGESFMIGDRYKDIIFGKNLGIKTIMVLTGYGLGEYTYQRESWPEKPDHICNNLLDAANFIKSSYRKQ